jgi:DNA primase
MSLSAPFLDEIRARTLLSGLIGRTVKLQRAGREWKACCPFHNEKTPSFTVNDDKGFYHCFGCSAHGDAIRWLTDARGLPFIDAVKELADAAGLPMPAADPRAQEKAERAAGLYDVMEAAQRWFEEQLGGLEGAGARAYLEKRGISDATRRRFGFGYAPDSRAKLRGALKAFGDDKLVEAGLLIVPEGEREPYDRFRGRLTFPIRDRRGRVIAFSARILGAGEPKYLNSPDTPLFDKGRTLFNIDKAAAASREAKRVVVVEGQMDVIALDQAGIGEAVAPLGTAMTEAQLGLLWQLSSAPIICFDGDAPGQKAAHRAALRALPLIEPERTISFVTLPPGQDPDDLIRGGGTAALKKFLSRPTPLVERLWQSERSTTDPYSPESRAALQKRLRELAESIKDPLVRRQYEESFRDLFFETFGWRKRQVQDARSAIAESRTHAGKRRMPDSEYALMRAVLLGLSRYPEVLREEWDDATALEFSHPKLKRWFEILTSAVLERPFLDEDLVEAILSSSDIAPIEKRDLARDLGFSFFRRRDPDRAKQELREVIATLVAERRVEAALKEANARFEEANEGHLWEEQKRWSSEKQKISTKLSEFAEAASQSEAA